MSKIADKIVDAILKGGWIFDYGEFDTPRKNVTELVDQAIAGRTIRKSEVEDLRAEIKELNEKNELLNSEADFYADELLEELLEEQERRIKAEGESSRLRAEIARRIDLDLARNARTNSESEPSLSEALQAELEPIK